MPDPVNVISLERRWRCATLSGMAIDESQLAGTAAQKPELQVINGGRAHLERCALDAVFTDPDKLPDLLKQLSRPAVRMGLVVRGAQLASHDSVNNGR